MDQLPAYPDRSLLIRIIGAAMFLVGLFLLFLAPLEAITLSFFSEGGRFEYEGFRFGGLMFGNIVSQIFGYYLLAIIAIPLGYGHLRLYRWSRRFALTLLYDWLVLGAPLSILVVAILLTAKDLPTSAAPLLVLGFLLLYPVLPLLFIAFYRSQPVQMTLDHKGRGHDWTEALPQRILVIGSLMIFFILALHVPILFNGIFPLFGRYHFGLNAILLLDGAAILLILLTWGVFKQALWAWWGTLIHFGLLIISAAITFLTVDTMTIFEGMKLTGLEWEVVQNVPLEGFHLALLFLLPLLATFILLLVSRRYFTLKSAGS